MPWTVEDVDSKKKGLSAKQKRQWVAIANSVLEKCKADGGSEETCAASAIRQANGSVGPTGHMETYGFKSEGYQIKRRRRRGREQIVVPVVMMVEGVHNGSHGPLLHLAEEFGAFPSSWDGIPVMVNHPQVEGQNVSANSPEVLEQSVGRVFNTHVEDNKLKAEVWLDEERLRVTSPQVLSNIEGGIPLDVSVGVFAEEDQTPGVFNESEQYVAVSRNPRPDHLALLPGEAGACSWDDGCGIRVNKSNLRKEGNESMTDEQIQVLKSLPPMNNTSIQDNEQGYQDLMSKIYGGVNSMDNDQAVYYLEDVYDGYFVYRKRKRNAGDESCYKQSYSLNSEGGVELAGEPVKVRKEVNYVQVNIRTIKKEGDKTMADEKKPCCPEKVTALIANKANGLTEADSTWLSDLNSDQLDRLFPVVVAESKPVDLTGYVKKDDLKTEEDFINLAPTQQMRDSLRMGMQLNQERKNALIQSILTNSQAGVWTKEELEKYDVPMLDKLGRQFKVASYVGAGAGSDLLIQSQAGGEVSDVLYPAGLELK